MKVQLLLLLALVGLLCAFTSASPTTVPELNPLKTTETQTAEMTVDSFSAINTWIPSTQPVTVPAQFTTKVFTESAAVATTLGHIEIEASSTASTEGPTEVDTRRAQDPTEADTRRAQDPTETEGPTETGGPTETEGPVSQGPDETEGPRTETPAQTEDSSEMDITETDDPSEREDPSEMDITETEDPSKSGASKEVIIDNGTEDGLSSGQIVSIVVGALLAVAITTAVVIVVVRRMGKYSP